MLSPALRHVRTSWMPKYVPTPDCVLYFPGQDNAYSATIRDISGKGNDGTITGATWTRTDKGLWCLSFDGGNDYVRVASPSGFPTGDAAISVLAWVKCGAVATRQLVIQTHGQGVNIGILLEQKADDGFRGGFHDGANSVVNSTVTAVVGSWFFLVYTYDLSEVALYVNGGDKQTSAYSAANLGTASIDIGTYDPSSLPWNGLIALPRVFNSALSAEGIRDFYRQERHLFGA